MVAQDDLSMGHSAKYTALDHEGLEVVSPSEAPEVAKDEDERLPEVKVDRKDSSMKPEAYAQEDNKEAYIPANERHSLDQKQVHAYYGADANIGAGRDEEDVDRRKEKRYCCGLTRKTMIILLVAVILVVIVGAVLGGTLGTLLGKNKSSNTSSSSTPLQTTANTGLASVVSAADSGHLLTYYQDPQGRIIENSYQDGSWTLSDSNNINMSIVTTAATAGSPLAAISYPLNGQQVRQIFFVTSTGNIMTANSTTTLPGTSISSNWSGAVAITPDLVAPNSISLAACWSNELMNGIRVFYPSQYGYVQELKWTFGGNNSWVEGDFWLHGDVNSGIACAVANAPGYQYINAYMRWSTGIVNQVYYDFTQPNGTTTYTTNGGPVNPANETIAVGSDIAVSSDSSQTEYVYWTLEDGTVARGIANPKLDYWDSFDNFTLDVPVGSKFAAAFIDGGSLLMYQNKSSDSTIETDNVSRGGAQLSSGTVP